jgi:hypothetical protein
VIQRGCTKGASHRLSRKVLAEVATVARPDTILGWYRKLVARKFSGSQARQGPGRGSSAAAGDHTREQSAARSRCSSLRRSVRL